MVTPRKHSKYTSKYFQAHYCYAVQRANGDIKLGYSFKLPNRVNQLRTKFGAITVLGVIEGDTETEARLHEMFAADQIWVTNVSRNSKHATDWFKPSVRLIRWIEKNTERYEHP